MHLSLSMCIFKRVQVADYCLVCDVFEALDALETFVFRKMQPGGS
jgi:hypothetical protein